MTNIKKAFLKALYHVQVYKEVLPDIPFPLNQQKPNKKRGWKLLLLTLIISKVLKKLL